MQQIKKILITKEGQVFYVKNLEADYHNQFGFIKQSDLQKQSGSTVISNTGVEHTLLDPTFSDLYAKIKRNAQIITRKDIGPIITETCLGRDHIAVEFGAGSGGLTCYLAYLAKWVYSFDNRKDHLKTVQENLDFLSLKNATLTEQDLYEQIPIEVLPPPADLLVIDLTEPWKALEQAVPLLKPGAFLVSYSPSITQSLNTVNKSADSSLLHIKTILIKEEEWDVRERIVHPKFRGLTHTGFLSFFRKIK